MIYDCFTFYNELDLLRIRCEELKGRDVCHILVESPWTFSGIEKPLYFDEHQMEFEDYPILHVVAMDMPNNGHAWTNEAYQRDAIMQGLIHAKDDDIIIISDLDEIPMKEAVLKYTPDMGVTSLLMDLYYYWLNCRGGVQTWPVAKILTYEMLKKSTPNKVRNAGFQSQIANAGHHFGYLGDVNFIINKLKSFSHQEYNIPEFTDPEKIANKLELGEALINENKFEFIEINDSYPAFIRQNKDLFKHLIK